MMNANSTERTTKDRSAFRFMTKALLTAGFVVGATGALAQVDNNGIPYPDNPNKTEATCSSGEAWGLPDGQVFTLHFTQTSGTPAATDTQSNGEIYLPRPCSSAGAPLAGDAFELVNTGKTTPVDLTGAFPKAGGGIVGISYTAEGHSTTAADNGYKYAATLTGGAAVLGDETTENETATFNFKWSYDPGSGQAKKHWNFTVNLTALPLAAPGIVNDGTAPPDTVYELRAESSKNVHVNVYTPTDVDTTDTTAKFYIKAEVFALDSKGKRGASLGSNTTNTVAAATINAGEHDLDIPLGGLWAEKDISAEVEVSLVQVGGATKPAPGVAAAVAVTIPKSPKIDNLEVGEAPDDPNDLTQYVGHRIIGADAADTTATASTHVFHAEDITERLDVDLTAATDEYSYTWTAASSAPSVATVTLSADDDRNVNDDTITIKGVLEGTNAAGTAVTGTAFITVIGTQNAPVFVPDTTITETADKPRMVKEIIKVTVLNNRTPVFNLTAATIRWEEHEKDQTVDLTARFVLKEVLEDDDKMQRITYAFTKADGTVIAATDAKYAGCAGNPKSSRASGFYVTPTGTVGVLKTGSKCDGVATDFEANESHELTVHASDGAGGSDVLALTIDVRDLNDLPTSKESTKELPPILEKDPKPRQIDLASEFSDQDEDKLCYDFTPPSNSTFVKVVQSGPTACKLPNFTVTMVLPSVDDDTPNVGHTGVESYSFTVTAKEHGVKGAPSTEPVTVKGLLVYGQNLGPQIWGGRTDDKATDSPYLSAWELDENSRFSATFTAQDVQPSGDILCFKLPTWGPIGFGPTGFAHNGTKQEYESCKTATAGSNGVYKVTVYDLRWYDYGKRAVGPSQLNYERSGGPVITSTLSVTDLNGASASQSFTLTLKDVPEPPAQVGSLPDLYAVVGDPAVEIDLSKKFRDGDGDTLTFAATSDDSSKAVKAAVDGNMLTISYSNSDIDATVNATIDVTAEDPDGTQIHDAFMVMLKNSNEAPVFDGGITAVTWTVNENSRGALVGSPQTATDPDEGDSITYAEDSAMFSIDQKGQLKVSGSLDHEKQDMHMVTVTASDKYDGVAYLDVTVEVADVNESPFMKKDAAIPDMTVLVGVTSAPCVMTDDHFDDPDARDKQAGLLIDASSKRRSVATVEIIDNNMVCVTGVMAGTSYVTVTATDRDGKSARDRFEVMVAENMAPTVVASIGGEDGEVTIQEGGRSSDIDLNDVFDDGDVHYDETLTFNVSVDGTSIATATLLGDGDSTLRIYGDAKGAAEITVTATDQNGSMVSDMFTLNVDRNDPPMAGMVADVATRVGLPAAEVSLDGAFTDEGDTFDMVASTADADIATAAVVEMMDGSSVLRVHAHSAGDTTATITATDSAGNMAHVSANISVGERNDAPTIAMKIEDVEVEVDGAVSIALDGVFADQDDLTIMVDNEDESVADVIYRMTRNEIRAYGIELGSTSVTVTATDTVDQSVTDEFVVTVVEPANAAPVAVGTIAGVDMELGSGAYEMDVGEYFTDPDGDVLSFTTSVDGSAAYVSRAYGSHVYFSAYSKGSVDVIVTATDPEGLSAIQSFSVSVSDGALKKVASDALAGYGRAMISSVATTITSRIDSNRADRGFGFSRFQQSDDATSMPSATAFGSDMSSAQTTPVQASLYNWNGASAYGSSKASLPQLNQFVSKNFSKSLDSDGSWSVWSSADAQNFEGTGYAGKTATSYLGVDMKKGDSLLFGVTVSRNRGSSDYSYGTVTQQLDTALTTVLPYVNYAPSQKTNVWGVLGRGFGDATTTVHNLDDESSALSMNIGVVGGRHQFAQSDSMEFALRGDAAFANLATASGLGSADDLSANVNRMRLGVETAFTKSVFGQSVTPFSEVALRYDGGDGLTGSGVEVAGGLRVSAKALQIEARGRVLASHSAENFKESGMSVEATINPSSDGSGFSLTFAPSWGASTQSSGSIWAEKTFETTGASTYLTTPSGRTLDTRLGYGLFVGGDRFMVTPYVDYRTDSTDSQAMLLGAELKQLIQTSSDVSMRFELGRTSSSYERPSNQVGFTAELRF